MYFVIKYFNACYSTAHSNQIENLNGMKRGIEINVMESISRDNFLNMLLQLHHNIQGLFVHAVYILGQEFSLSTWIFSLTTQ